MKLRFSMLLIAAAVAASGHVFAQSADDVKWINQCIKDNKDEGATPTVVRKYCECMNDRMDETERRSITEWEKKNPGARRACEKQAGWK